MLFCILSCCVEQGGQPACPRLVDLLLSCVLSCRSELVGHPACLPACCPAALSRAFSLHVGPTAPPPTHPTHTTTPSHLRRAPHMQHRCQYEMLSCMLPQKMVLALAVADTLTVMLCMTCLPMCLYCHAALPHPTHSITHSLACCCCACLTPKPKPRPSLALPVLCRRCSATHSSTNCLSQSVTLPA